VLSWPLPTVGLGSLVVGIVAAVLRGKLQTKGQVDAVRQDYRDQIKSLREDHQAQLAGQAEDHRRREDQLVAQGDAWKAAYFSETQVSSLSRQQLAQLFELARMTEVTMRKAIEAQPPERSGNAADQ